MIKTGNNDKPSRKQQILESLARMLEKLPGERITTAALAAEVGVSEAALYRHFPSKARMFEDLIAFIEDTLFTRINVIVHDEEDTVGRCEKILLLVLTFADKNPGMTRLLTGDALAGETERLRKRIAVFFDRLETQLRQLLREAQMRENKKTPIPTATMANLLLIAVEGRLSQFVRSEFRKSPLVDWQDQWDVLSSNLLVPVNEAFTSANGVQTQ